MQRFSTTYTNIAADLLHTSTPCWCGVVQTLSLCIKQTACDASWTESDGESQVCLPRASRVFTVGEGSAREGVADIRPKDVLGVIRE